MLGRPTDSGHGQPHMSSIRVPHTLLHTLLDACELFTAVEYMQAIDAGVFLEVEGYMPVAKSTETAQDSELLDACEQGTVKPHSA